MTDIAANAGNNGQAPANGTVAATGQQLTAADNGAEARDGVNGEVLMLLYAAACLQRLAFR